MKMKKLIIGLLLTGLAATSPVPAQRFFPDDPLEKEPPPDQTIDPSVRNLSGLVDYFENVFGRPGDRQPEVGIYPAQGINTLGEVMDGPWFTNRYGKRRMTLEELRRGPGNEKPPSRKGPWRVLAVKRYGDRNGILIADVTDEMYFLRFDPPKSPELATGATMVASKIFYALGYWTLENYIVYFDRQQLVIPPKAQDITSAGRLRKLVPMDVDLFLKQVPKNQGQGYRAVATRVPKGTVLGPFQFYGTRSDDPNDIIPHEHRRDLRGLFVFSSWINHNFVSPVHTLDILINSNGIDYIRHYQIDFFATLGSGILGPKSAREGNEPMFDLDTSIKNFLGFGIYTPRWERANYKRSKATGLFEYEVFDPERWTPNYEMAPFANRLPDDTYWAAKIVMAFTDDDIRALVETGRYSKPESVEWLTKCLIERRNKIGKVYLAKVLPLDNFRVEKGELKFEDLEVHYGFTGKRSYSVKWSEFRNYAKRHIPIPEASGFSLPEKVLNGPVGSYSAAEIAAGDPAKRVIVYLRKEKAGFTVVGIDRNWPGKKLAPPRSVIERKRRSHYSQLKGRRKELFDDFTRQYNEKTGLKLTPEEYFRSLSLSERTTFDAVTHALMHSKLTDPTGKSLGTALDLVDTIERIAGQYPGREGDAQFRLYCRLKPGAKDILTRAKEFRREKDNTVYHQGYPTCFRQEGKVPNIQFSMSEDATKADIDVDYRSSKLPEAMWNGHLTAANSDVRAGNNYKEHRKRWAGLVNWWQSMIANLEETKEQLSSIFSVEVHEEATPLPPNRPPGAHIEQPQDAMQEFLTDWLVRRHYDEALEFIADDALACVKTDASRATEKLTSLALRRQLRNVMRSTAEHLGRRENLATAIKPVLPWDPAIRIKEHAFDKDFTMVEVPDRVAEEFMCGSPPDSTASTTHYGTYFGTMFQVRIPGNQGGILALLWKRINGEWRVVTYATIDR